MDKMERKHTHYCVYCTCEANIETNQKPMSLLHIQMQIEAILVCENIKNCNSFIWAACSVRKTEYKQN